MYKSEAIPALLNAGYNTRTLNDEGVIIVFTDMGQSETVGEMKFDSDGWIYDQWFNADYNEEISGILLGWDDE